MAREDDGVWLRDAARRQLQSNWREGHHPVGGNYAFTIPATPRYRHQWYWDSCYHAIAWSRLSPRRARAELRTLVRAARGDGLVPHTVFWDRPARWRRAPLYATHGSLYGWATATTQTPLLGVAWERVAAGDVNFAREGLPFLRAHHRWLFRERDPGDTGLLATLTPDESGLDDAPKYDRSFGRLRHDGPGYFLLLQRCRRVAYSGPRLIAGGAPQTVDVLFNVAAALSLRAHARLEDAVGTAGGRAPAAPPGTATTTTTPGTPWRELAERVEDALLERCYDERSGLFYDLGGPRREPVAVSTWSSLAPLALDAIPEHMRRRLVEEHLLDERRYRAGCGIPSVSMQEPTFSPGWQAFRTWRGPSWMSTAWLLVAPMRALGYEADAERIVRSLLDAVRRGGFREYYNPLTGGGLGARGFGFSTLLVDLV